MAEEEVFYNDLDDDTIYGDATVSDIEDLEQENLIRENKKNTYRNICMGTVTAINIDDLTIDIKHGEAKSDAGDDIKNREYKGCKILGFGGQDDKDAFVGIASFPKVGTRVVYTFLLGYESQPIVLGTLLVAKNVQGVGVAKEQAGEDDHYFQNGKLLIWKKYTGEYIINNDKVNISIDNDGKITLNNDKAIAELLNDGKITIKNDNAEIEMLNDGNIDINNGTNGVARKNDEVKSTSTEDTAFWTFWQAMFTVIKGAPILEAGNGAPSAFQTALALALASTTPSSLTGKITKASDSVKAGGASA